MTTWHQATHSCIPLPVSIPVVPTTTELPTAYAVYSTPLACGPWTAALRQTSSAYRASGRRENHSTHHVLMLGEGMVPPFLRGHPEADRLTKQLLLALMRWLTQRAP